MNPQQPRPYPLLTIDVAHPPRSPAEVEALLLDAWSQVRNSPGLRVLKIIHGYGSTGKGGSSKETVRNWAFRNRARIPAIINGEDYGLLDPGTQAMRNEVGMFDDGDLDAGNPGIVVLWIK